MCEEDDPSKLRLRLNMTLEALAIAKRESRGLANKLSSEAGAYLRLQRE